MLLLYTRLSFNSQYDFLKNANMFHPNEEVLFIYGFYRTHVHMGSIRSLDHNVWLYETFVETQSEDL